MNWKQAYIFPQAQFYCNGNSLQRHLDNASLNFGRFFTVVSAKGFETIIYCQWFIIQ